jgi:predicted DNA-binding protein (UPF0251 family)
MGKIVELRPRDMPPPPRGVDGGQMQGQQEASVQLMASVGELIRILEASHRRIRVLIDAIPDADAAARLGRDHATLSAALRDAKLKIASLDVVGRAEPEA